MKNIIGGEFEIDKSIPLTSKGVYLGSDFYTYSSGRSALYNILNSIKSQYSISKILLPDYLCNSIIETVKEAHFDIVIYELNDDLHPDINKLQNISTGLEVILIINYFGLLDCEVICNKLRRNFGDLIIVQDNVQAPFAMVQHSYSDFSFSSFRKSFPVPDGAWGYSKKIALFQPQNESDFVYYKLSGSILKGAGIHNDVFDKIYLDLFSKGESILEKSYIYDMSEYSKYFLSVVDWTLFAKKRKRNANIILSEIEDLKVKTIIPIRQFSVNDDRIPLFIPIVLENRDSVRKALFNEKIYCPVHWPIENMEYEMKSGLYLSKYELSIVVDQRYGESDMLRVIDILKKVI